MTETRRADYGLDAPGIVRTMGSIGLILVVIASFARFGNGIRSVAMSMGISFFVSGLLMVASSRIGKLKARDALLDKLVLTPTDNILDVGCGRGLMLMGAAKRATNGHAVGIDLWSNVDQLNNSRDATLRNAEAEGISGRIEVRDGDMRSLPFPDASFDAVVSSLAIHNLDTSTDRDKAIAEIARVLKPGGRVGVINIANVGRYASQFESLGLRLVSGPSFIPWIFPPARVLVATKS